MLQMDVKREQLAAIDQLLGEPVRHHVNLDGFRFGMDTGQPSWSRLYGSVL